VPTNAERQREIGAFFTANADRLRRAVASRARDLPDATIEDACQTAWTHLVPRSDTTLDRHGFAWLTTVAIHEAWQQNARAHTEAPSGGLRSQHRGDLAHGELPEPAADTRDVADQVADRIQHNHRLEDLATIKPNDRRALYLQGLGYTYHEIMQITGATYTAVISGPSASTSPSWCARAATTCR
jgi:DNA-directed RNA polymerase specialized sigma24 family protein